jgi:hypothetical protein
MYITWIIRGMCTSLLRTHRWDFLLKEVSHVLTLVHIDKMRVALFFRITQYNEDAHNTHSPL